MSIKNIDLNCDLGEWRETKGAEKDARIMPFITSCNIACGGHIGDEHSMQKTVELAIKNGVKIGAHPSFPDRENFGRKKLNIYPSRLFDSLCTQVRQLGEIVAQNGETLHHIKPHGALYNEAAKDEAIAEVIVNMVLQMFPGVPLYAPMGSMLDKIAAEFKVDIMYEAFADRAYEDDLSLRPRALNGAVLHQTKDVLAQIERMVIYGEVVTFSGLRKPISAQTICLHSDTEGSIRLAEEIYDYLKGRDVEIAAI